MILEVVVYAVLTAVLTVVLATSLFLIEDLRASSFREQGVAVVLGKCLAIVVAVVLVGFLPFGGLIGLVVWFIGVMALFQKTFLQALLVTLANYVIGLGAFWVVARILIAVAA